MEPKTPKPARLSVDEETKEFLEVITDRLSDAMLDFVKREDLLQSLQDVEARVSGTFGKRGDTLMKSIEAISQRLEKLEANSEDVKRLLLEWDAHLAGAIESSAATMIQSFENAEAKASAIMTETDALNTKANGMIDRLDALEGQISELVNQLARLSRPWWRKLFG